MHITNAILASLLLGVGFLLFGYDASDIEVSTRRGGENCNLYIKQFIAIDADTGEVLNVWVRTPTRRGSDPSIPSLHEIHLDHTHRITCMARDVPIFTLSLDGYVDKKVPLDEVTGTRTMAGTIKTERIEMRKIQSDKTVK